ncbi:uncharacterized protein E0L32_009005 [Thyridium curvatum]|uniref:TIP41-like protein n=1 Tax=Thyridium curvatum TaxID=1093900 RepID=A0A507ATJ7_9PEZI|nr:uncharacterized protein E0L32_009005 [Thyridium curvatum]TPX09814.1 hypothetical protein E0L32_009005 [Thyridium curvatum]
MTAFAPPDTHYPSPDDLASATSSHTQGRFRILSRKLPISKAAPIDAMSARVGIPIPEMIFGDNLVAVTHLPTGWTVCFAAEPALDAVGKTADNMLQVAHAREWGQSRERTSAGIREVVRPFDWTYSSAYAGTVRRGLPATNAGGVPATETPGAGPLAPQDLGSSSRGPQGVVKAIPLELLRRRDPILFNDEVILYESELDDNGVSMYSVKFRVMPQRMLLLARLYMRLDGVLVRVRDTRVYVDFETDEVIREYTAREDSFDNVKRGLLMTGLLPDAITVAMRDANQVVNLLPIREQTIEYAKLSS